MPNRIATWTLCALAAAGLAGCGGGGDGTFVIVTVQAGASPPVGVTALDVTAELGASMQTRTLEQAGALVTLPIDFSMQINNGSGSMRVLVTARAGSTVLTSGSAFVDVMRGETARVTITLGVDMMMPDGGVADGGDGSLSDGAASDGPSIDAPPLVPAWGPVERIGHDDLANEVSNFLPQVAVSANGDALVTFYDQSTVWARRYVRATDSWDTLLQVNDAASGGVNARVAMDAMGNGMVAWYSNNVGGGIFARRFTASLGWPGGWSPVETAVAGSAGVQNQLAHMAMTGSGHAVIGYERYNSVAPTTRSAFIRVYEKGLGWSASSNQSAAANPAYAPDVDVAQVGNTLRIVASWYQSDAGRLNVVGVMSTYDLSTHGLAVGALTPLESDATNDHLSPRVGIDSSGNAMVIFQQRDATSSLQHVLYNRFASGAWSGAAGVDTAGQRASDYGLTVNGAGGAVVVFRQCGATCAIWGRRFINGAFTPVDKLSTDENSTGEPEVALDGTGRALAVWSQNSAAVRSVYAAELSPTLGWTPAHLLETDNADSHEIPAVGFGAAGTGVAAWVRTGAAVPMRRKILGTVWRW